MNGVSGRLDRDVKTVVTRYYQLTGGVRLAFLSLWGVVVWCSFSTEGFLVAGDVFLVLYLVDTVPLFDLRTEGALETEKSSVPVREEFEELLNPIAAFPVAWVDEIHEESTDGGGATAVLKGTLLKLFRREYSLHVTRTNDDSVQIQCGEDEAAVKLSIASMMMVRELR